MQRSLVGLLAILCVATTMASDLADQGRVLESMPAVEPHRARIETVNRNLTERLDDLLPGLMRETGIDLWLVINREYAEDPVYLTLVPEPVFAARRTTMLVFHDHGEEGVKRLTVSRYPIPDYYEPAWEGGNLDDQWKRLGELIAELDPRKIGINVSRDWPLADGLTASLRDRLMESLTPELQQRTVSAQDLVIRWLETRSPGELQIYPHIVALARRTIAEAFSNKVITPGATTTDDVLVHPAPFRGTAAEPVVPALRQRATRRHDLRARRFVFWRQRCRDRARRRAAHGCRNLLHETVHRHSGDGLRVAAW